MMNAKRTLAMACVLSLILLGGCVPLMLGGAAAGAGAGTYVYVNGELRVEYNVPFEKVRTACEMVIADLGGQEVTPDWKIGMGTIQARIQNEKVTLRIEYKSKDFTILGVRVGYMGNKESALLIKDKISDYLVNNP
ncbi:MAG: DUF3568 family protein [Syntrophales bacterium]|jgi:hypothetical protein